MRAIYYIKDFGHFDLNKIVRLSEMYFDNGTYRFDIQFMSNSAKMIIWQHATMKEGDLKRIHTELLETWKGKDSMSLEDMKKKWNKT